MGSNSTTIPTTSVAELKYLSLLARDYPTQAAAASAVISLEATAKLPKGTEHYISDLHGEDEAFIHLLNSASGHPCRACHSDLLPGAQAAPAQGPLPGTL